MKNKKINIAELLKNCPKGMKLYSPLCGICVFDRLDMGTIICKKQNTQEIAFTSEGYYMLPIFDNCECMLFPSKDQRDWSKFQRPFKDGDILACNQVGHKNPTIYIYYHNEAKRPMYYIALIGGNKLKIDKGVLFSINENAIRFATEEEKEKLFNTIKENGYRWNTETKSLEKLISDKFDINTLVPFESRVLVRDQNHLVWIPAIYGYYVNNSITDYPYCIVGGGYYRYLIPYENNEHLLGTKKDCDDFYKTWK
jgi:hypothetical protein